LGNGCLRWPVAARPPDRSPLLDDLAADAGLTDEDGRAAASAHTISALANARSYRPPGHSAEEERSTSDSPVRMILPIAFTGSDSARPQISGILYRARRTEQNDASAAESTPASA